jgi:hypothetical protein
MQLDDPNDCNLNRELKLSLIRLTLCISVAVASSIAFLFSDLSMLSFIPPSIVLAIVIVLVGRDRDRRLKRWREERTKNLTQRRKDVHFGLAAFLILAAVLGSFALILSTGHTSALWIIYWLAIAPGVLQEILVIALAKTQPDQLSP